VFAEYGFRRSPLVGVLEQIGQQRNYYFGVKERMVVGYRKSAMLAVKKKFEPD
jgi:hypothetical protein